MASNNAGGRILDKTSIAIGALAAVVIIAIAFAALSSQQAGPLAHPSVPSPQPPPVQAIANNRLPSDFQVVLKNTNSNTVQIAGITIGNTEYNLTANLSPGEIRAFDVSPPDCSGAANYNCSLIIRLVSGAGAESELPPQALSGNYTAPPPPPPPPGGEQGNGTGQQGSAQPAPLDISTDTLAEGTVDLNYGFSLEATGGSGIYVWTVSGLPPQLTFNSNGRIYGTAFEDGTYTVHLTLQDGVTTVQRDLPLTIRERPG